jgi:hypothetical protein
MFPGMAYHLSISQDLWKGRQRKAILQTSLQEAQPPLKPGYCAAVPFSEAPMVGVSLGVRFLKMAGVSARTMGKTTW